MYRSINIKNFRCFDALTVSGMGRINLITGKNNVGKTALLEALWVHGGPTNPARALSLDFARGLGPVEPEDVIGNLFLDFDQSKEIEIAAESFPDNSPGMLKISSVENPEFETPLDLPGEGQFDAEFQVSKNQLILEYSGESGVPITSKGWLVGGKNRAGFWSARATKDEGRFIMKPGAFLLTPHRADAGAEADNYSRLERKGWEKDVVEILRNIEPRLNRLFVSSVRQRPVLYADIGISQAIPVRLLGEGMSRILALVLAVANAAGGVVLVDEVENGIHHSVMEPVWQAIGAFARSYDVQLFATTHSYECIGAAYRAFESDEDDELRLFRLQRNIDGAYKSVEYDQERLKAVFDMNMEFI